MPTDAAPRRPRFVHVLHAATGLAVLLLAVPGQAQFTPRFKTLAAFSVQIGGDHGKQSFALADINADQRRDLIAIDPDEARISVYLNQGDGTFEISSTPETFDDVTPYSVAVADVTSPFSSSEPGKPDGVPDIIIGSDLAGVQIMPGKGDGTFDSPDVTFGEDDTGTIIGMVTGDFDEENGVDVAVVDEDGVWILCNDGNGNLGICSGDEPVELELDSIRMVGGDFDADADLDVAVLDGEEQLVFVIRGNGDGTLQEPVQVNVTVEADSPDDFATDLAAGRMDGDNIDDLVAINSAQNKELFGATILGSTQGRYRVDHSFVADFTASAIVLADFDAASDRALDAIVGYEDGGISALIGNGTGDLGDPFGPIGTNTIGTVSTIATADLGGDTLPDFIVLNPDGDRMQVALNTSNEATPTPGTPSPTLPPTPTVTGSPPPTSTATFTPPATSTPTATNTPTPVPTADYGRCNLNIGTQALGRIAVAPFDADGSPDIAVTDLAARTVRIILNTAGVQQQLRTCAMLMNADPITVTTSTIPLTSIPGPLVAVDIDRDGDRDLAVGDGNFITILTNDGDGRFTAGTPIAVGNAPAGLVADFPAAPGDPTERTPLDLNRDGRTDLVVANSGSAFLSILYGAEGGGFTVVNRSIPGNASRVTAADYNQDGRVDLVASRTTDALLLTQTTLDANNQSVFQSSNFAAGTTIRELNSAFFNGDRSPDLLLTRDSDTALGETQLFSGGTFGLGSEIRNQDLRVSDATAAGVGLLNSSDNRADVVTAGQTVVEQEFVPALQFSYGDGAGAFPPPVVEPYRVRAPVAALAVANVDGDGMQDVVTANQDGTVTVLLSSVPPPTPTPTVTFTVTETPTPTITLTPSITQTPSETPTPTPEMTGTPAATSTRTGTVTPSRTPKEGAFALSNGCAISEPQAAASSLPIGLVGLLLALVGPLRRGAGRWLWLLALAIVLPAARGEAQLPPYGRCEVTASTLGSGSGLRSGAAGPIDTDLSPDLVLLDNARTLVALVDRSFLRVGLCADALTMRPLEAMANAAAIDFVGGDAFPDLALALRSPRQASLYNGDGTGSFVQFASSLPLVNPLTVALDFITDDAEPDLVIGDANTVKVLVFRFESGVASYQTKETLSLGDEQVLAVRVADFSGDGLLDIAAVDLLGRVRIFVQDDDGKFAEQGSFSLGSDSNPLFPSDMQVADPRTGGDLDRNGIPDLVFVTTDGQLLVYLGRRGENGVFFERGTVTSAGASPVAIALGDLNGDRRVDAVVADGGSAQVLAYLGNGSGALGNPSSLATRDNTTGVLLARFDEDALDDIAATTVAARSALTMFLSSNPPTPTATITPTATDTPTATPTATETGSPTWTPTETPTATPTSTGTNLPTGTVSPTRTGSPTATFGGFLVQGEGCANITAANSAGGGWPLLALAVLALVRFAARPPRR